MTTSTEPRPSLNQRMRGVSLEAVGFALIGLSGVVVNFAVFWICVNGLGLASLRSNIAATVVAIATNYLGYRYWLYKDRDAASRKREITLFLLFSGIGMLIETGVLGFSVYVLGLDSHYEQLGAKVAGLAVATVFRFVSYRTWVFKALPDLEEPEIVAEAELLLAAEDRPAYTN
ncbi:GtrA family protein [Kitasatospora paracochleata]|uniref:Flippase GtrA n=1 Tax=Kitasatospora paracochleata TaxID=58354 RepID=A0ABT1IXY2_9ACTN|nr:GtrA family protein [Kitasatospora paracochleata]MCP2310010.1 putative flippase GtrA [Kitasatospora paracochleata]